MIKTTFPSRPTSSPSRRSAFTLVEILVAVSIMAVLLVVILVPLRMGFEAFTTGKSRSEVQMHAQLTLNQIANDLRKAQFVFANSYIPGITDNKSVTSNCSPAPYKPTTGNNQYDWNNRPYVISDSNTNTVSPSTGGYGVCSPLSTGTSGMRAWNNVSRIDMLQLRSKVAASSDASIGQDFIVTYYPRRLDITKPFDVVDNPIVLFRAQIPFRGADLKGNPASPFKPDTNSYDTGPDFNANIDWTQYPDSIGTCTAGETNRSFLWITHNFLGEADLQPLTDDANSPTVVPGAHTQVTPRDMSLVAPAAGTGAKESMVPELSFREESSDGRRIDRVTITMTLAQYDSTGTTTTNGTASAQRVRVTQTVDLPNASCGP
jgi:prepilin-type N-terminal cleavage/methylation domain-containing protein